MKYVVTLTLFLFAAVVGSSPAQAARLNASGKISLLRVHDKGSKYGPANDQIDVEVVVQLGSKPGEAYGFTLRNDDQRPAHQGMLDLLRDALEHDWTVFIDYDLATGKKNGRLVRVWVKK